MNLTLYRFGSLVAAIALAVVFVVPVAAQDAAAEGDNKAVLPEEKAKLQAFNDASKGIEQRMLESEQELRELNASITEQKLPLSAELRKLEEEFKEVRRELEKVSRQAANRALEEKRLTDRIDGRKKSANFISNRFDEYIREFEAGVHIAEMQLYEQALEDAKLAMENRDLSSRDRFGVQKAVVEVSLDRLEKLQGGMAYTGSAIDSGGVLGTKGASVVGQFVQFGPVVVFSDSTGELQGIVQQRLGTLLPEVVPFVTPENSLAVKELVDSSKGTLPLDATLGEAQTVESIQEETLLDKFNAGGPVMYPILGLGVVTILVGLYKWIAITLTPSVSRGKLARLLVAVGESKKDDAKRVAESMKGPTGRMLRAGVNHLGAPRDLIEEVMYEQVLSSKLKINRLLPVVAICAAAAPLLGLLGTVSGIINTFKMMQISGGADMQNVSGGISEALLTTMFGLIVAIPSLILHVFLSRKARGVVDGMEMAGVALINEIMKSEPPSEGDRLAALSTPSPDGDTPPSDPPRDGGKKSPFAKSEQATEGEAAAAEAPDEEPVLVQSVAGEQLR